MRRHVEQNTEREREKMIPISVGYGMRSGGRVSWVGSFFFQTKFLYSIARPERNDVHDVSMTVRTCYNLLMVERMNMGFGWRKRKDMGKSYFGRGDREEEWASALAIVGCFTVNEYGSSQVWSATGAFLLIAKSRHYRHCRSRESQLSRLTKSQV